MIVRASASDDHRAGREHLHRDVAERGRLDRAGDHGAAGRVRGELIQQAIARSAADDADFVERGAGQLLERLEHDAVLEREALEDRAGKGGRRRRAPAGRSAGSTPRSRSTMSGGWKNAAVVRIEERSERVAVVRGGRRAASSYGEI